MEVMRSPLATSETAALGGGLGADTPVLGNANQAYKTRWRR